MEPLKSYHQALQKNPREPCKQTQQAPKTANYNLSLITTYHFSVSYTGKLDELIRENPTKAHLDILCRIVEEHYGEPLIHFTFERIEHENGFVYKTRSHSKGFITWNGILHQGVSHPAP